MQTGSEGDSALGVDKLLIYVGSRKYFEDEHKLQEMRRSKPRVGASELGHGVRAAH